MREAEVITSMQNAKVRRLLTLQQKSAERRREGLFVVEGRREVEHCAEGGFAIDTLYLCPQLSPTPPHLLSLTPNKVYVSPAVYEKAAYRGTTEGVIALVRSRERRLDDLPLGPAPLLMVVESVEKPGNLGAILRSADAAGATAVVVCDPLTDLYNPNLIRASIGACFTVSTVACTTQDCIDFLKSHGIRILTAQLQDSQPYYNTDMTLPTAIVMGTEATGLTTPWREAADAHIRIPMLGRLDSLNVSVSAAILLFEAVRQRNRQ